MQNLFDQWKAAFEHTRLQFNLGKMDAVDAFEKYKDQIRKFVVEANEQLTQSTNVAEEKAKELKEKLESLKAHVNVGKAENIEAFEEQKKKIESLLHEVYVAGKDAYATGFQHALAWYDANASWMKTQLEILQLQFSLGKMEAKEEAEDIRKKLDEKMDELQQLSKHWQQMAQQNVQAWTEMANDNMEKFRHWMQQFQKK